MDSETDSKLENVELQQLRTMLSSEHNSNPSNWISIFKSIDKNNDGEISFKELKHHLKQKNLGIPENTVRSIIRKADLNENGTLNLQEFLNLLQNSFEVRGIFSRSVDKWVNTVCVVPQKGGLPICYDVRDSKISYEEHYNCCPPPIFMILISGLELTAYIYDAIESKNDTLSDELASLFIYNPHRRTEAWRYLTYMFVHIGVFHLLINIFVQIVLGIPLEMVHHWWRVLLVYFSGVIAGSLGTSVSQPGIYLAGASGGVYAVLTAHLASIIVNWSEKKYAAIQLLFFIILVVSDVGSAVYDQYVLNSNESIGYVAHFAGAVAGLLVGINVLKNFRERKWEKRLKYISFLLYLVFMIVTITWNAAFPEYFPKQYT